MSEETPRAIDLDAAIRSQLAEYELAGRDAPNLKALVGAATLAVVRGGGAEEILVPRRLLEELTRNLGRYLQDEGLLDNSKPRTRAPRRPRESERRPLATAKALAPHFRRWKAVILARARRGLMLKAAVYEAGQELGQKPRTIEESYRKIETLRKENTE